MRAGAPFCGCWSALLAGFEVFRLQCQHASNGVAIIAVNIEHSQGDEAQKWKYDSHHPNENMFALRGTCRIVRKLSTFTQRVASASCSEAYTLTPLKLNRVSS